MTHLCSLIVDDSLVQLIVDESSGLDVQSIPSHDEQTEAVAEHADDDLANERFLELDVDVLIPTTELAIFGDSVNNTHDLSPTMERGTEREREAVRDAWDAIEARRSRTDAFLLGGVLVGSGCLIVAVALLVPLELCVHGAGVDGAVCTTQRLGPNAVLLALIAGSSMIGGGGHMLWQSLRPTS